MSLDDKVVIITGAAQGIGQAMALGLYDAGAKVVAVDLQDGLPEYQALDGSRFLFVQADITEPSDCNGVVDSAVRRLGTPNVLVNNAGIGMASIFPKFFDRGNRFYDVPFAKWRKMVDVNINGTFAMTAAAVRGMKNAGWGRIVNVTTSKSAMVAASFTPYGPSKAAVEAMTVAWALELAEDNITVNVLIPGAGVDTPMNATDFPDRSLLVPPSIMVPPLAWLASDQSDGVTSRRFIARRWRDEVAVDARPVAASVQAGWAMDLHDVMPLIL